MGIQPLPVILPCVLTAKRGPTARSQGGRPLTAVRLPARHLVLPPCPAARYMGRIIQYARAWARWPFADRRRRPALAADDVGAGKVGPCRHLMCPREGTVPRGSPMVRVAQPEVNDRRSREPMGKLCRTFVRQIWIEMGTGCRETFGTTGVGGR